jgi:tetratricopeptide (TPR) repeat protein/tRNA A-37 threonylcarbamoyl transferase component Bud32
MDSARWREVERVLDLALDSEPARWPALLDEHCADDPALRREVEKLLRHHGEARTFLTSPPAASAASLLAAARGATRLEGMRVGAYRIVRQIGEGGSARVFLAERDDGEFNQQVALKLLRPGYDTDVDQGRFRAERQILASLSHPNIARLLDGGVFDDGLPYLVMELVEGEPIDRYCDAHGLLVAERLKMFLTACEATRYAHRNLVVHRDLKPSNILITSDGQLKLVDFGLAKLLERATDGGARSKATTQHWMTPEYAAPEQLRGEPTTTLTDVYQLGVVLYELLTGSLPFGKRSGSPDLAHEILDRDAPAPSAIATTGHLRGDVDAIVLKALRKEPEQRYASVEALASDIERHLAGMPVSARQGNAVYLARRFMRRHRLAVTAATAIGLLLAAYAVTLTVYTGRVRGTLARVEQEKAKAEVSARFLTELFSPIGAGFGPRDTLSARQLIARGQREVEELGNQPIAQAQLLSVLGSILHTMREYDRAESLLARALALRRTNLEWNDPDVAESMYQLGMLAHGRGNTRRARELIGSALAIQLSVLGDDHPATVESRLQLSVIGTPIDVRIGADREALALARRVHGDSSTRVAEAMLRLGISLRTKGAHAESESLMRDALALRRRVSPADQFNMTRHRAQLAILLTHRGKLDEAERIQRDVLAAQEALNGPDHPTVSGSLRMLASVLMDKGNFAEAERLLRRDVAMRERSHGGQHVEYTASGAFLANALRGLGRLREAEALRRAELASLRATYGDEDDVLAGSMHHLAELLMDQKRYDEAKRMLAAGLRLRERDTGPESPPVANLLPAFARLAREQGDFVAADTLIKRSLRILKEWGYLDAQDNVQRAHGEAVRLYESWGKPDLAARHRALVIPLDR